MAVKYNEYRIRNFRSASVVKKVCDKEWKAFSPSVSLEPHYVLGESHFAQRELRLRDGAIVRENSCHRREDAMVMGVKSGMWREIGDMWGNGERVRVGKIVVVNGCPMLFMFDGNEILMYFL
ncbi:hypothetical protein JHK84_045149 [Glycine max]|nr:hypothetical protein JHK84_045149 [Glycine max]